MTWRRDLCVFGLMFIAIVDLVPRVTCFRSYNPRYQYELGAGPRGRYLTRREDPRPVPELGSQVDHDDPVPADNGRAHLHHRCLARRRFEDSPRKKNLHWPFQNSQQSKPSASSYGSNTYNPYQEPSTSVSFWKKSDETDDPRSPESSTQFSFGIDKIKDRFSFGALDKDWSNIGSFDNDDYNKYINTFFPTTSGQVQNSFGSLFKPPSIFDRPAQLQPRSDGSDFFSEFGSSSNSNEDNFFQDWSSNDGSFFWDDNSSSNHDFWPF